MGQDETYSKEYELALSSVPSEIVDKVLYWKNRCELAEIMHMAFALSSWKEFDEARAAYNKFIEENKVP